MKHLYNSQGDFIAILHQGFLFSPSCTQIGQSYDNSVMVRGGRYLGDIVGDRLLYNHNTHHKNAVFSITYFENPELEKYPAPPERESIALKPGFSDIDFEQLEKPKWLLREFKALFLTDNGSLPQFYFENLTGEQVCTMYNWLRSQGRIYKESLLWDTQEEREVSITDDLLVAERVISGRYESFRHELCCLTTEGVVLPKLTVAVTPNSLSIEYPMGEEWTEERIWAMISTMNTLQKMAPQSNQFHVFEGEPPVLWRPFLWESFKKN